ncbi:MAG: hypothetical protein C4539_11695 [Ignavibacteriales bacterium]|nr:MAG: hypothetical protein C4539_11695 [Ignavibacteriales bacterium]
MHQKKAEENTRHFIINNLSAVNRITALWAFSEAAFGGVLHAFRIPFSGLFICGAAVIFISLIAHFSERRWEIVRSTLIVVLVKVIISPNTPVNAHFAVLIQGMLGQLLFLTKRFPGTSSLLLGILASSYSAVQKVVVLTIVFGFTLWESLDQFGESVMKIFFPHSTGIRISLLIIGIYSAIHMAGGIASGIIAGRLPIWMKKFITENEKEINSFSLKEIEEKNNKSKGKSKRRWWKRPSGILILSFSVIFALLTYIFPFFGKNTISEVIIMIIRSVLIVFLWFTFAAPYLLKLFRKFVEKKKNIYTTEINNVIILFPRLRYLVNENWKRSDSLKGLKRIKHFVITTITILIFSDIETE